MSSASPPSGCEPKYRQIVAHYEACLQAHGDHHRGVDWPNAADARTRYRVMLDVIRAPIETPVRLLDFGCGAGHLYEFLLDCGVQNVDYSGLDLSPEFIKLSRSKFPERAFYCGDVLDPAIQIPPFDYVVLNGILTEKCSLSFDAMWAYAQSLLRRTFQIASVGIAFNVMSKQVDWERGDLFHLSLDELAEFLMRNLSRHFVIRNDYGLYEYTVYVYHHRTDSASH